MDVLVLTMESEYCCRDAKVVALHLARHIAHAKPSALGAAQTHSLQLQPTEV